MVSKLVICSGTGGNTEASSGRREYSSTITFSPTPVKQDWATAQSTRTALEKEVGLLRERVSLVERGDLGAEGEYTTLLEGECITHKQEPFSYTHTQPRM